MIREATRDDLPAALEMAHQFVATTIYRSHIAMNPERLVAFMELLIADPDRVLIVSDDRGLNGMLAACVFDHPYSGERTGCELWWWVNPEARGSLGIRLLRHAEQWAKDHGAIQMQMVAPTPEVERIYQHLGFEQVETLYQKVLDDRDSSRTSSRRQRGRTSRRVGLRQQEAVESR